MIWYCKCWYDVLAALTLLTRLPVPATPIQYGQEWAYPIVGAIIGGIAASLLMLCLTLTLPPTFASLVTLMTTILATGALHEDGLADCADGAAIACGSRDKRFAAMRDSQLGTGGVLALILSATARISLLVHLITQDVTIAISALITAHIMARAVLAGLCAALPLARSDGLAATVGRASPISAVIALGIALSLILLIAFVTAMPLGHFLLVCTLGATLAASLTSLWALIYLGGQTGDLLGAGEQMAEIMILAAIAMSLSFLASN